MKHWELIQRAVSRIIKNTEHYKFKEETNLTEYIFSVDCPSDSFYYYNSYDEKFYSTEGEVRMITRNLERSITEIIVMMTHVKSVTLYDGTVLTKVQRESNLYNVIGGM